MKYMKHIARKVLGATAGAAMLLGLPGVAYAKNIQEYPEPWQILDIGKPPSNFPTTQIVKPGIGVVIEQGDLVQVNLRTKWGKPEPTWISDGDWWIWIGFRDQEETNFFNPQKGLATALVGQRQGSLLEFTANGNPSMQPWIAERLVTIPIGDPKQYSWRKGQENKSVFAHTSVHRTPSVIEVLRVCKGKAMYRTIRLFDDGPVQVCSGLSCRTSVEPREAWIDEAKIEASCSDGRIATFQYGPVGSRNGKEGRSPVMGYFDQWIHDAWEKIPKGVQLK
jgi:hypothetical protein